MKRKVFGMIIAGGMLLQTSTIGVQGVSCLGTPSNIVPITQANAEGTGIAGALDLFLQNVEAQLGIDIPGVPAGT